MTIIHIIAYHLPKIGIYTEDAIVTNIYAQIYNNQIQNQRIKTDNKGGKKTIKTTSGKRTTIFE